MSKENLGTALVTGASSGIGATYAERLAKRGYDLILVARDLGRLNEASARLSAAHGVKVDVLQADLTVAEDVRKVEKRIREDAAVTLVVNNAGIGYGLKLLDSDVDALDRLIALNITAVNRLAVAAAQTFAPRGKGAIINIASVVAIVPELFNGTYSATKSYVLSLTQSLNAELAERGVKVQAVMPGLTRTEIFERAGGSVDDLDPKMVMEATDMVDAALAGFDQGELITIPSLPDPADWQALDAARGVLGPNLSHDKPAARYGIR
jgi:short-subunit dehydrogenase